MALKRQGCAIPTAKGIAPQLRQTLVASISAAARLVAICLPCETVGGGEKNHTKAMFYAS
jgi:hypothetical protein